MIKVTDQGIGIAKEHLPFIEQSFYQINNHIEGAGIGLAIVKKWWSFMVVRLVLQVEKV